MQSLLLWAARHKAGGRRKSLVPNWASLRGPHQAPFTGKRGHVEGKVGRCEKMSRGQDSLDRGGTSAFLGSFKFTLKSYWKEKEGK